MNTYILDKEKIKNKNLFCLEYYQKEVSKEEIKKQYKDKEIVIYYGDSYVYFDWYYDERNDEIKEKTKYWKFKNNEYQLQDGEYIEVNKEEIFFKPKPITDKPYKWNKKTKEWEIDAEKEKELQKEEEDRIAREYFPTIDLLKEEILSDGFEYQGHRQRCREKDMIFIASSIMSLESAEKMFGRKDKIKWAFNDFDYVDLGVEDLKMLQLVGTPFFQKVYAVEKILKAKTPFKITKSDYLKVLNKIKIQTEMKKIEEIKNDL